MIFISEMSQGKKEARNERGIKLQLWKCKSEPLEEDGQWYFEKNFEMSSDRSLGSSRAAKCLQKSQIAESQESNRLAGGNAIVYL